MTGKYRKIVINPHGNPIAISDSLKKKYINSKLDIIKVEEGEEVIVRFQFTATSYIDIKMIDTRHARQNNRAPRSLEILSWSSLKIRPRSKNQILIDMDGESDL